MAKNNLYYFKDLLEFTRDGEWGKGEPQKNFVAMMVIRGTDFQSINNGCLKGVPTRFIPLKQSQQKVLKAWDVLIETAGGTKNQPTGRTAIITPELLKTTKLPLTCSSFARILRFNESIVDPQYMYWILQNLYKTREIEVHQVQHTGIARFQFTNFAERFLVQIPDRKIQTQISEILGTIDAKIVLSGQMNEILEAMAQALFQSWFVDFDPVIDKALASGKEIPEPLQEKAARREALGIQRKRLPPEIETLFPDEFIESELGWIPKGWKCETLQNVLRELISGSRPKGGAIGSGIPSIGAENIIGLGKYNFSKEKFISLEHFEKLVRRGANVQDKDVLLYKDGAQIGRKTYFDASFPHKESAVNEHVFILRAKEKNLQRYMYFWLDQDWMTKEIIALNSNSAQPGINQKGVFSLKLLSPTSNVLERFDQIVESQILKIFRNSQNSQILTTIRDTLLPKLISGEIRIPEAEAIVEEALNV